MRLCLILSLFICFACNPTYRIEDKLEEKPVEQIIVNPYFKTISKEYEYRFKISFLDKEMKGNFVVKKLDNNTHRAVMTSDFGNTLFDLTIHSEGYTLNYAMPDLNKKMIVKTLAEDLQMVLRNEFKVNNQINTSTTRILLSKEASLVFEDDELFYFNELNKLKGKKIKTTNQFQSNQTDYPEKITIKHHLFKLKIELNKLIQIKE